MTHTQTLASRTVIITLTLTLTFLEVDKMHDQGLLEMKLEDPSEIKQMSKYVNQDVREGLEALNDAMSDLVKGVWLPTMPALPLDKAMLDQQVEVGKLMVAQRETEAKTTELFSKMKEPELIKAIADAHKRLCDEIDFEVDEDEAIAQQVHFVQANIEKEHIRDMRDVQLKSNEMLSTLRSTISELKQLKSEYIVGLVALSEDPDDEDGLEDAPDAKSGDEEGIKGSEDESDQDGSDYETDTDVSSDEEKAEDGGGIVEGGDQEEGEGSEDLEGKTPPKKKKKRMKKKKIVERDAQLTPLQLAQSVGRWDPLPAGAQVTTQADDEGRRKVHVRKVVPRSLVVAPDRTIWQVDPDGFLMDNKAQAAFKKRLWQEWRDVQEFVKVPHIRKEKMMKIAELDPVFLPKIEMEELRHEMNDKVEAYETKITAQTKAMENMQEKMTLNQAERDKAVEDVEKAAEGNKTLRKTAAENEVRISDLEDELFQAEQAGRYRPGSKGSKGGAPMSPGSALVDPMMLENFGGDAMDDLMKKIGFKNVDEVISMKDDYDAIKKRATDLETEKEQLMEALAATASMGDEEKRLLVAQLSASEDGNIDEVAQLKMKNIQAATKQKHDAEVVFLAHFF